MLKYEVSYDVKTFEPFFKPSSVAVIGASAKTGTIGNVILRNFLKRSFRGKRTRSTQNTAIYRR